MEAENNIRVSFAKEIEGYLNNKRCLYEAEGRREYLPLVDQALSLIRNMKNPLATEQSASSNPTFDRPSEKMHHYAEGEAIDCAICIEHVEANHAQVRLSCGHIYHLNCLGSHFNHSGDYKCPYCRDEVDKYAKQPRIWEHPVNGPPQTPNQIDTNDIPHPGELDFANFQRGVLQVVNSIFGGRLNLGHPFRNDNGTEDYYDNDDESQSEIDDPVYDTPRYVGSNDSESSDDSEESEDDREYDRDSNIGFRSQRHSYYSSSNEALSSSARRNNPRLVMDSTARSRSISRNRPRPDSMSGSAFRSRPQSFATDTTPRSEVNEMSRHASTSSRLRNMYQGDSTDDLMDDESDSGSSTSSVDSDDANEGQLFNWDASNDMDTSDDDSGSEDENGGYRRRSFSHRSSSSSISPISSSSEDEENENDNESIVTTSTNNSRPEINQHWYKPWSWYNNNNHQETLNTSTISAPDSDATISSGEDFE